jgi:adenylate cyclase
MESNSASEAAMTVEPSSGVHRDAIREQLGRILASPEFHATDKMRGFLRFVVEEKLAGRSHRLKGYTVAVEVFGRGEDFDAANDPIVRIQAGRLRRALERYYLVAGRLDPILIDIPKGRYVPRFTVQKLAERPHDPNATATTARDQFLAGPTLAVVPLDDLARDPEQQFLTIGLTNELVTELNRFQDIVVISCDQDPGGGGPGADRSDQGGAPDPRFVLRGAVRSDPHNFKVSMQLTDAMDGRQLWAEAYTHPLEAGRFIATQEEIARNVVAAVASEYGIIARRLAAESRKKPPAELDTYEAMLRYYTHQISPSPDSGQLCLVALQRAAEREPVYGPVWSALATLHCQMYSMDVGGFGQSLDTALEFARRGVSLEPGSQLGRLVLAYASYLAEDSDAFEQEGETALALNPNSPYTVGAIGYFHVMRGSFERGLPMLERAIAVNPCHPDWFHAGRVIYLLSRRDYDGAFAELEKHDPFFTFWLPAVRASILGNLGRLDEAQTHLHQVREQKPDFAPRARELIRRSLKIDAIIDDLIVGLRTGGMEIEAG